MERGRPRAADTTTRGTERAEPVLAPPELAQPKLAQPKLLVIEVG